MRSDETGNDKKASIGRSPSATAGGATDAAQNIHSFGKARNMIKKYVGKRPAAALSVWLLLLCLLAALAVVPAGATDTTAGTARISGNPAEVLVGGMPFGAKFYTEGVLVDGDVPSAFAYPEEESWLTIPLDGLRAYEPQKMALARHSDDCAQRGAGFIIDSDDGNDAHSVRIYRSTDGNVYAAVMQAEAAGRNGMAEWEADVFFTVPALDGWNDVNDVRLFFFHDLLGHSGFTVSYSDYLTGGPGRGGYIDTVTDYYYLDNSGTPYLLAHAKGDAQLIDLNGDGALELCTASGASGQIFFLRDGRYYEADVKALLQDAWPEMNYWDHASWDLNYRRLTVRGFVSMPAWATAEHPQPDADFTRYLYYRDGELLVYKPDKDSQTVDHVVGTPDGPEPVLAAAKATVQKAYQDYKNGGYDSGADLDNWRVEYVAEDWYRAYPNGTLIAYNLNYEYHAQKPANVTLAGGAYVDEDGWLMPDYPYCHYLFFIERNSQYTFLEEQMINDAGPGSEIFEAEMQRWAVELGLASVSDAAPEELLPGSVLNRIVVPKKITVHLGKPSANVRNVTVSFQSYIANVASSEVYPTWDSAPGTRRTSI